MSEQTTREVARTLEDGSFRALVDPHRVLKFHRPSTVVPPLQWASETGLTRYQWARQHTPKRQVPFFLHLQRLYQKRPPQPFPREILAEASEAETVLENGTKGYTPEFMRRFNEVLDEFSIMTTDPEGEWNFSIDAGWWRGVLCDKLCVSCVDYRTLPDWALLVRFRSWVLSDDREAVVWLPDQDPRVEGWEERYVNVRPNMLQMISPRPVQPDGSILKPAVWTDVGPSPSPSELEQSE